MVKDKVTNAELTKKNEELRKKYAVAEKIRDEGKNNLPIWIVVASACSLWLACLINHCVKEDEKKDDAYNKVDEDIEQPKPFMVRIVNVTPDETKVLSE